MGNQITENKRTSYAHMERKPEELNEGERHERYDKSKQGNSRVCVCEGGQYTCASSFVSVIYVIAYIFMFMCCVCACVGVFVSEYI